MFDADAYGRITAADTPDWCRTEYEGLDRFDALALIVQRMKEAGRLVPQVVRAKDCEEIELNDEPRTWSRRLTATVPAWS